MNNVERYMVKMAQFIIDNPLPPEEEYDYSIPVPQNGEQLQVPSFIRRSTHSVLQDPWYGVTQSEADGEQEGSESDFDSGSSGPDNGMGMI